MSSWGRWLGGSVKHSGLLHTVKKISVIYKGKSNFSNYTRHQVITYRPWQRNFVILFWVPGQILEKLKTLVQLVWLHYRKYTPNLRSTYMLLYLIQKLFSRLIVASLKILISLKGHFAIYRRWPGTTMWYCLDNFEHMFVFLTAWYYFIMMSLLMTKTPDPFTRQSTKNRI